MEWTVGKGLDDLTPIAAGKEISGEKRKMIRIRVRSLSQGGDVTKGAGAVRAGLFLAYYCHQDKKEIRVWRIELPNGTPEKIDSLAFDAGNPCPSEEGASVDVPLEDGKAYRIVTTDGPHSDTDCSTDDPQTVNCQRYVVEVAKGAKDGAVVDVTSG